jgi:hypothetical protein
MALVFGAHQLQILNLHQVQIALELGYILIVPGILFSGLMITIDSWAHAYRNGGVLNYGVAAYNTYAQIHNTVSAIETMGGAFKDVFSFFGSKKGSSNDNDAKGAVIIILVLLALASGIITTAAIIRKTAGSDRLPSLDELENKRAKQATPR